MTPDFLAGDLRLAEHPLGHLAICGKHPGWNDHIEDIGLDTPTLRAFKRHYYATQIAAAIAHWREATEPLLPLEHILLAQRRSGCLVALQWPSEDGKGRADYPMMAMAHLAGMPVMVALRTVLPLLQSLKQSCLDASDSAGVLAAFEGARSQLTTILAEHATSKDILGGPPQSWKIFLETPALAGEGFSRLLYQMKLQAVEFAPGRYDAAKCAEGNRGDFHRVPHADLDQIEALVQWLQFFRTQVDAEVPLMLASSAQTWVDVLIGFPSPAAVSNLRRGSAQVPVDTEIAFNLDAEFQAKSARIAGLLSAPGGHPQKASLFGPPPQKKITRFGRPEPTESEDTASAAEIKQGGKLLIPIVAGVVVLLVLVGILIASLGSTPDNGSTNDSGQTQENGLDPAVARERIKAEAVWAEPLLELRGASLDPLRGDRYLIEKVVQELQRGSFRGGSNLDNVSPEQLQSQLELLEDVRENLADWPLPEGAASALGQAEAAGWDQVAAELQALLEPVDLGPEMVADLRNKVAQRDANAPRIAVINQFTDLQGTLKASGKLSAAVATQAAVGLDSVPLISFSEAVRARISALQRFQAWARSNLSQIDVEGVPEGLVPSMRMTSLADAESLTDALDAYRYLDEATLAEAADPLRERLGRVASELDQLDLTEDEDIARRQEMIHAITAVRQALDDLTTDRWNNSERASFRVHTREIGERVEALEDELGELQAEQLSAEAWRAQLRETSVAASAFAPAWQLRRQQILDGHSAESLADTAYRKAHRLAENWRRWFETLDQKPEFALPDRGTLHPAIRGALDEVRSASVLQMVESLSPLATVAEFEASEGYREMLQKLGEQKAALEDLDQRIDAVETAMTTFDTSAAVRAKVESLRSHPRYSRFRDRLDVEYHLAFFTASHADPSQRFAAGLAHASVYHRVDTLRQFTGDDAPVLSLEQLHRAQEMIAALEPGQGRSTAQQAFEALFRKAYRSATDPQAVVELYQLGTPLGLGKLAEWRPLASAIAPIAQAFQATPDQFEAGELQRQLLAAVEPLAREKWQARVAEVSLEQDPTAPKLDLSQVGANGWALQGSLAGVHESLTLAHPGIEDLEPAPYEINFVALSSDGLDETRTFVSTSEIPTGLFLRWMDQLDGAVDDRAPRLVALYDDPLAGGHQYPRSWKFGDADGGFAFASEAWQFTLAGEPVALAESAAGEAPSPEHPVQWIPATAATTFAESLGARLPRPSEWAQMTHLEQPESTPNLRDAAWKAQQDRISEEPVPRTFPAIGAFSARGPLGAQGREQDQAVVAGWDDGLVWFAPADPLTTRILHLKGNVAEFLQEGDAYFVAGTSALSDATIAWTRPLPVASRTPFSDVGLRLAIDVPVDSALLQLHRLMTAMLSTLPDA